MQSTRTPARTSRDTSAEACATAVLETAMLVMRAVRRELWRSRPVDLTVTQLRGLACVSAYPESSLSDVAEFVGLTLPGTSRLVATLVRRGLLAQQVSPGDRRRVMLRLTPRGRTALETSRAFTRRWMAGVLTSLDPAERTIVARAMKRVGPLVTPPLKHGVRTHAR
jgi:MarR family transcriptional regulator for hemolysin